MKLIATAALGLLLATAGTASAASINARGSAEQAYVTGATPGATLTLVDLAGKTVATHKVDSLGAALFTKVKPAGGYRVRAGQETSAAFRVLSNASTPPTTRIYNQTIPDKGYGYLTTRDGTQLAINVQLPSQAASTYPTLVEYSGYGYARPSGGESSIAQIATLLGYAVVDVNMRGTGCSGGSFDYFEPLQGLDGYDVIETVARQPWAARHKVGMMGVSYGGISQLFVGATAPPSLAAITPLSVIDNTATTLYPGGILNTGFALSWAKDRVHDAKPASATGGQAWALERIKNGDTVCQANQALHAEAPNMLRKIDQNSYYVPAVADPLSPVTFVDRIKAPTFLACQWTDEQTGGHCPSLPSHFTGTKRKWFTFTNGVHTDSLDPETFNRWFDFLELYVAHRAPKLPPGAKAIAPTLFKAVMGVDGVQLPDDSIQGRASYAEALAAFEKLPPVRVLFDNGAGSNGPGAPGPGFEQSFASFPPPKVTARLWYFGARGALTDAEPATAGHDRFTWDPAARRPTDFTGDTGSGKGGLWTAAPDYHWAPPPAGSAAAYVSPPLRADTTVIGAGAIEAWVQSSARNVDLQATISEVRPDHRETFVQNGWLRTSARRLDRVKSTLLEPVPDFSKAAAQALPKASYVPVTIPLYYQGHAYRKGSRLRVVITAPGGDQPIWAFGKANPRRRTAVLIARSADMPSHVALPVVPGVKVKTKLPPCPGLRGEPCRRYVPYANR